MKRLLPAICAFCFFIPAGMLTAGSPFEVPHRSVSSSRQFVIYCDDNAMRMAISTFCEQTKSGILQLLSQRDDWKIPVVINIFHPEAVLPTQPLSEVHLYSVEDGTKKIELNVTLRGDLADIRFQQQLVRVILLEMEYRNQAAWQEGVATIEPPSWLVEGLSIWLRNRDSETDPDVYKRLLGNTSLPSLENFLSQSTSDMNAASLKLYQAYSFSFLQLITGLQNGPQGLASFIHDLPLGHDSPTDDLLKHFPALGGSEENLEKWWTLSMAHLAATESYKGLSVEESDQRLTALLQFKIPTGKNHELKVFSIGEFKDFVKNPDARPVLAQVALNLQHFSAEANPLFKPIVFVYLGMIDELQKGKTKHADEKVKEMAKYREMILTRMDQIADYMNWFEATQMVNTSNSFLDYMKTANELSNDTPKRDDAVSKYLDSIEIQMQ